MNRQDSSKPHLELKNVGRTTFRSLPGGQKYSVKDAPASVFDAWISQFVEEIVNVDRTTWDIFQRWNVINAVLAEGLLVITHLASGDKLERPPVPKSEANSEEKPSTVKGEVEAGSEEKASELSAGEHPLQGEALADDAPQVREYPEAEE